LRPSTKDIDRQSDDRDCQNWLFQLRQPAWHP
jgi:hypothetical protein